MTNVRVVLLIDASMETAAALSSLACDAMVKPILTRLEALHNGSDLQMAFVTYSFPSSPSGSNGYGSIACDKFRPFSESYNILRNQPLLIGLARISNVEGDSMALIDAFIQALKFCDAESPPYSSSYPTFHFIIITSHPPQITRRPPPRAQKGLDCLVWEQVPIALQQRSVNLSLIQTNSHPILPQLLSQTMDSSRFTRPWFPTGPYLVKLAGMDISDDREGRGSTTITTVQSASSPRGTKRRHVEEDGSTSMYSFSDDQNKRPRQASPSKLPPNPPTMPQGTIANSRAIGPVHLQRHLLGLVHLFRLPIRPSSRGTPILVLISLVSPWDCFLPRVSRIISGLRPASINPSQSLFRILPLLHLPYKTSGLTHSAGRAVRSLLQVGESRDHFHRKMPLPTEPQSICLTLIIPPALASIR
ncbi:uncharacterized protein EI90DRAFT_2265597 [Cantharellus anzutake]|uniref:uncharacterized protein n=1 Tax=Cantharellus anzutake TaxID=1750568 RepID=UPI001905AE31|nr:uncharacterized protein EI90DRAFT_2265597 [Cantharellus anzutake]KAF8339657.1 hypothetical protein EI90DRAFT_2265597 [Cantharellus anzutake]